jgi:hypothetical protein
MAARKPRWHYRDQVEKLHRERMSPAPLKPYYNGTGEAEVVPGFQLQKVLQIWVEQWVNDRPLGHQSPGIASGASFTGPFQYIAEQTGLNPRRISAIHRGEIKFIALSDADEILSAMNLTHLLATGEIQVVPNPNWSLEKWLNFMDERGCI